MEDVGNRENEGEALDDREETSMFSSQLLNTLAGDLVYMRIFGGASLDG